MKLEDMQRVNRVSRTTSNRKVSEFYGLVERILSIGNLPLE